MKKWLVPKKNEPSHEKMAQLHKKMIYPMKKWLIPKKNDISHEKMIYPVKK